MQEYQSQEAQIRFALMIRVIRIKSIKSRKHLNEFSLQIQYMMPHEGYNIPLSSKKTKQISKMNPVWIEEMYYNNIEYNNGFHFTLHCSQPVKFESIILQGRNIFSIFKSTHEAGQQTFNLKFKDEIGSQVDVEIQISVFQNQDCIVGLSPPQISLTNLSEPILAPGFSSIQVRRSPSFNCFSCMDSSIEGFDRFECYPTKFKTKNKRQQPK